MSDKEQLETLLKECNKEKLHLCGHIQPFGTLIGISKEDFSITYVSENCESLLHVKPASLLWALLTQACPSLWRCVEAFLGRVKNEPFLRYFDGLKEQTPAHVQAFKAFLNKQSSILSTKECIQSAQDTFRFIDYLFARLKL